MMPRSLRRLAAITAVAGFLALPVAAPVEASGTTHKVPVLMYHRVGNPSATETYPDLYVREAQFDKQMAAMKARGWKTITAEQLGAHYVAKKPVPAKTFVITFDDGRPNNYTLAFPILQKYGFVATFYINPGLIGVQKNRMTWDQAAEMAKAGMELANHTMTHIDLWTKPSSTRLATEIKGAHEKLIAEMAARGVTVKDKTFAYPYGHYTDASRVLLKNLGYTIAVTAMGEGSISVIGTSSRMLVPRVRMHLDEPTATFLKHVGA